MPDEKSKPSQVRGAAHSRTLVRGALNHGSHIAVHHSLLMSGHILRRSQHPETSLLDSVPALSVNDRTCVSFGFWEWTVAQGRGFWERDCVWEMSLKRSFAKEGCGLGDEVTRKKRPGAVVWKREF